MTATIIHLTIEGHKQGAFKGDVTGKGKANVIRCLTYSHAVTVAQGSGSGGGAGVGKAQHYPIVVQKAINHTSPPIMQALLQGEALKTVRIELRNATKLLYTITLSEAFITRVQHLVPQPDATPDAVEEVEFTAQKIEWTSADGKTVVSDRAGKV